MKPRAARKVLHLSRLPHISGRHRGSGVLLSPRRGAGRRYASGAASNIFIVGFMASGKTKLGRFLAERLGWRFLDTDAEIQRLEGRSVSEIFAKQGEAHFRVLEARAVIRAARGRRQVVAVGGGAVMNPMNVEAMRRAGIVLYRQTPFDVLFERAERKGNAQRPLWRGKSEAERRLGMARLLKLRSPHYCRAAHLVLRTTTGTAEEAADRALRRLTYGRWIRR